MVLPPHLLLEASMNQDIKGKIIILKNKGLSYSKIAASTGLSINTVKSLFRRQNSKSERRRMLCKNCGKGLHGLSGAGLKKFCSDSCRYKWWNKNAIANRKHLRTITCKNCGKKFKSYDNKARKYCCHSCYITYRFKSNKGSFI